MLLRRVPFSGQLLLLLQVTAVMDLVLLALLVLFLVVGTDLLLDLVRLSLVAR